MKVKSIAECSKGSIMQYFWPALSDNWSWKPIFGLFESGRFTQVLLYSWKNFSKMLILQINQQRTKKVQHAKSFRINSMIMIAEMGLNVTKPVFVIADKWNSNQSAQLQRLARKLKFRL